MKKHNSHPANKRDDESLFGRPGRQILHIVCVPKQAEQSRLLFSFVSTIGHARSQQGRKVTKTTRTLYALLETKEKVIYLPIIVVLLEDKSWVLLLWSLQQKTLRQEAPSFQGPTGLCSWNCHGKGLKGPCGVLVNNQSFCSCSVLLAVFFITAFTAKLLAGIWITSPLSQSQWE